MLIEIVDRTMAGEKVYSLDPPNIQFGKIKKFDLALRDLDVLREMMDGLTNEEIAERLGISVNTVCSHVLHILNKTGFKNRLELAINAASLGIVVSNQPCSRFERNGIAERI